MDDDENDEEGGMGTQRRLRYISMIKDPAERERFKGVANRNVRNASERRTLLSGGKDPAKPAIAASEMLMLLTVASALDLVNACLNAIPIAGGFLATVLVSAPGTLIMWFMYKRKGIDMKSNKAMFRFVSTSLIAWIPVINILPAFILNVVCVIGTVKAEEVAKRVI